jgi:predicted enzyme related to lactoylglutathione lyase
MIEATPVGRLGWIQIDCVDPERLAAFWGPMLGIAIDARLGSPPQYLNMTRVSEDGPYLSFQRVPESKTVKNRLHFDLAVDDVEVATVRVEDLGGLRLPGPDVDEYGFRWRVMQDPEGNEFCLIFEQGGSEG